MQPIFERDTADSNTHLTRTQFRFIVLSLHFSTNAPAMRAQAVCRPHASGRS